MKLRVWPSLLFALVVGCVLSPCALARVPFSSVSDQAEDADIFEDEEFYVDSRHLPLEEEIPPQEPASH